MRNFTLAFLLCILSPLGIKAQQVRPLNNNQIFEKLQQLNHLGTVLYLAAHPDDENTRLLSYWVHEQQLRTIYLSLTRGDGGQNLIGEELGTELGLIRNYELIAARKIDGAEQAFTSVIDFGYTKNPEETFRFWDKEKLVEEVKAIIKHYRPDIIVCRFPTTGEGGHGQHTASAIVAQEAFEQLKAEHYPFLPERLLFNAFKFGDRNTIKPTQFKIPTNQYNFLLGESYGEMAGRSRSIHRSQGAGTPQQIGISDEYFDLMAGTPIKYNLIDKDISWNRINATSIGKAIEQVIDNYDFQNPAKSLPALIDIRKEIEKLPASADFWKQNKLKEIDLIIFSCAGIMAELFTHKPEALQEEQIALKLKLIARAQNVELKSISFPQNSYQEEFSGQRLALDTVFEKEWDWQIPKQQAITQPYWLAAVPSTFRYQNPQQLHLPETPNTLMAKMKLSILGETMEFDLPISYKYLSPTLGDVVQPLRIVPAVFVRPQQALIFVPTTGKVKLQFWIQSNVGRMAKTTLSLSNPQGMSVYNDVITLSAVGKDSLYTIWLDAATVLQHGYIWTATVTLIDGRKFNREQRIIRYSHLPELVYYKDASIKLVPKEWQSSEKKIGYIAGAGDQVFEKLKDLGLNIVQLSAEQLSKPNVLAGFDVLITGVRAFNTNEALVQNKDLIFDFIQNGGNFIVQYNTSSQLLTKDLGPYPFKLGRSRVTDEDAKVTITQASDPLLNRPNKISAKDFENWVQERGLYFAQDLAPEYKTMLEMHDPNEPDLHQALFYAPYGKGNYIYTSLSFFRQIPAGNTGAIKLLLNMMEL